MNRIFISCIVAVVFLTTAVDAKPSAKFNKKLTIKIANEAAEYVLSQPVNARYPTACSYYGVLKLAQTLNDQKLIDAVKANYAAYPATAEEIMSPEDKSVWADKRQSPKTDKIRSGHVDWNVFGILPFELYLQTKDEQYLKLATQLAEDEWAEPNTDGLTAYSRFWVDDMFMVGALQVQAYKALKNPVFLDRASLQLLAYAKVLQQQNGLFQHTASVPVFWGRGNGWAAAVMALTLENMPKEHKNYEELMAVYKKMMAALQKYQDESGLWHQVLIDPASYEETSCTSMFTYAIATGIKNGWLDNSYRATAIKGLNALLKKVQKGELADICIGTSEGKKYDYYLNRPTKAGDLHGQGAFLWAASAMLQLYQ
ncbi:MAG: glycoside hydrolase family 88 protein [Sedimentisphaerales bacterium]